VEDTNIGDRIIQFIISTGMQSVQCPFDEGCDKNVTGFVITWDANSNEQLGAFIKDLLKEE
jgi:hypothetical protein